MRGIVLREYSGVVSSAFRAVGIETWSCDLLPTEGDPAFHLQTDAVEVAYSGGWDFAISHPVCTMLTNCGAKHLYLGGKKANGPNFARWQDMEYGAYFYRLLRDAPIEFKATENPIMHGHTIKATKRGPVEYYHPHFFGDPFFKTTGFELQGFPPLVRTHFLDVPKPRTPEHHRWSKVHRMAPSAQRGLDRSRFEPGFAKAMANQWGAFLLGGYNL